MINSPNSNNFNICPRCGTSNSLHARYCFQCGAQLKAPQEPVVCQKCHTVNTSSANFCRTCGAGLAKMNLATKECPKCHNTVDSQANVCSCGYVFANIKQEKPVGFAYLNDKPTKTEKPAVDSLTKKNSVVYSLVSIFWTVVFVALIFCPQPIANIIPLKIAGSQSALEIVLNYVQNVSFTITDLAIVGLLGIFALTCVLQILCSLVKLFKVSSKKFSLIYLLLAIVTIALTVGLYLAPTVEFLSFIYQGGAKVELINVQAFAIPAYFVIMTIRTMLKAKEPKIEPISETVSGEKVSLANEKKDKKK